MLVPPEFQKVFPIVFSVNGADLVKEKYYHNGRKEKRQILSRWSLTYFKKSLSVFQKLESAEVKWLVPDRVAGQEQGQCLLCVFFQECQGLNLFHLRH